MKTLKTISFLFMLLFCMASVYAQPAKIDKVNITLAYAKAYSEDGQSMTFESRLAGSDVQNIKNIEMTLASSDSKLQTVLKPTVTTGNGNTLQITAKPPEKAWPIDSFFDIFYRITLSDGSNVLIGIRLTAPVFHF